LCLDRHRVATGREYKGAAELAERRPADFVGGIHVFMLTGRAARGLRQIRRRTGLGDTIAVRISASDSRDGSSPGFKMRFASRPSPGDDIITTAGTKVFIAAGVAKPLESVVLDTVDTSQGEELVLRRRRAI
jgi:Fe-S cluster assembly iron-binding protein IscA